MTSFLIGLFSLFALQHCLHAVEAAVILNSTICGPAYTIPDTGFLVYGDSYGQDDLIKSVDPECSPHTDCVAFQCLGVKAIVGSPVVKCHLHTRRWGAFPYCSNQPRDMCTDNRATMASGKLKCWHKKKRWRFDSGVGKCVAILTCARSPPLGGRAANIFRNENACVSKCIDEPKFRAEEKVIPTFDIPLANLPPTTTPYYWRFRKTTVGGVAAPSRSPPSINRSQRSRSPLRKAGPRWTTLSPYNKRRLFGGLRGPRCVAGVSSSHTSCQGDSLKLVKTFRFNPGEILVAHNKWRRSVMPPAVNMAELHWSDELAITAERHAAQCSPKADDIRLRGFSDKPLVGQNILFSNDHNYNWTEAVDAWGRESKKWKYGVGAEFPKAKVHHYTQIVWAETRYIGCGRSECTTPGSKFRYYWVCNYWPSGNVRRSVKENALATPYKSLP